MLNDKKLEQIPPAAEQKNADQVYNEVQKSFMDIANNDIEAEEIGTSEPINISQPEQKDQYSETEKKAIELGWIPKDKFMGDGKYREAADWLEFHEISDKVRGYSRENKNLRYAVEKLNEMIINQQQTDRNQKIEELNKKKIEAVQSGDVDLYKSLDEQIYKINNVPVAPKVVDETPDEEVKKQQLLNSDPDVKNWYKKNLWVDNADDEVVQYAKNKLAEYKNSNPEAKNIDILRHIEFETKNKYPEYFGLRSNKPNNVSPSRSYTSQINNKSQITLSDLPGRDKAFVRRMAKVSNMSEQDYINVLVKTGAIKYER